MQDLEGVEIVEEAPGASLEGPTARLADFATNWRPATTPPRAQHEAKRALLDVLGVAMVGSAERSSQILAEFARHEGAAGPAVVIGHGFRTSASFSAFANGVTSHALDYDPSATVKTTGHPVVCVIPAALAAAEEVDASGTELLEAIIVGFEVVSRMGRSAGGDRGDHYTRGFHGSSVFGVFGATAAACRLLGLDVEQARRALGIASSGPKGVRANYGTMTKPLHAGDAARAGITAAMLARAGFTAGLDVIEARLGWAAAVVSDSFEPAKVIDGLGESLAIEEGVNFKRFPSCGASHAPIRATLRLLTENSLRSEDIEKIEITLSDAVIAKTLIFSWPTSPLEGKFCAPFVVAAAWADGRVGVDTFTDAKLKALEPFRPRITMRGLPGRPPITIRAWTVDGRELKSEEPGNYFDNPAGERAFSLSDLSDEDLRQKFRDNVEVVRSPEQASALLGSLDQIEQASSVRQLTELLF